jgi:two-component system, NarL family, response regulator DesR
VIDVVVVDDQADMRLLIQLTIEMSSNRFRVAASLASGKELLDLVARQCPDVVVLDQMMPGERGLDVAAEIKTQCPRTKMLIFSAFVDETVVRQASSLDVPCLPKDQLADLPMKLEELAA